MQMRPIYLDYAATTPVDPRVAEAMQGWLTMGGEFGNPASLQHDYGRRAHAAVEAARTQVADLIGAEPAEIVWTSGATEANNLAIKGVAEAHADRGRHIVTMKTEHKSVVDSCRYLEQQGWRITWLAPEQDGRLPIAELESAIGDDTVLVSIMLANNETGVLQDIEAIGRITRSRGVLLHVDAVQAVGRMPVDVQVLNADLLSLSAHKLYGPKGIAALYVRRKPRARVAAQVHGGGHERGMRSGTLAVHQVVGMGEACRIAAESLAAESARIGGLRDRLWRGISQLPGVYRNGAEDCCLPNILNLSFAGVDGEALHAGLSGLAVPLAVSSGSACTAASQESSYVLRALGRSDELAYASVRFSLGRWTTAEEVEQAISAVTAVLGGLRRLSPDQGLDAGQETADVEFSTQHPQYSDAVWRYFIRALQWNRRQPASADMLAQCATPGSRARLEIQLWSQDNRISAAGFRCYGCVSALATAAWLCEWLDGRGLEELEDLDARAIEQALALAPIKRHCALLAEDALGMLRGQRGQNTAGPARQAMS